MYRTWYFQGTFLAPHLAAVGTDVLGRQSAGFDVSQFGCGITMGLPVEHGKTAPTYLAHAVLPRARILQYQ